MSIVNSKDKCCYKCTERTSGCHGHCPRYLKELKRSESIRKEKMKDDITDAFRYECVTKTKNRCR